MNKLISAALLLTLASAAHAQMPTTEEIMKDNDLDHDGVITREEADKAGTPLSGFFDMLDANHDGKITVEEVKAMTGG